MSENTAPKKELDWVKSPDGVLDIYANMAHLTWTLDDVRVRLGQVVDSPETPNPGPGFKGIAQERAAVTMSWRNAKLLRDQLTTVLNNYEKLHGEIEVKPELTSSI